MKLGHRILRWLAVVSPPAWAVLCAFLLYALVEGLHQYTLSMKAAVESEKLGKMSCAFVIMEVILYSLYRGWAFHPASREDYLRWLALTPWHDPTPLPLGPVHLVAQDLVFLGMFELMLLGAPLSLHFLVPAIFLFIVLGFWGLWTWSTGFRSAAYEIGYALATTLLISSFSSIAAGLCLIVLYFHALRRLRQSFATFPWEGSSVWQFLMQLRFSFSKDKSKTGDLYQWGWACDLLSPQITEQLPGRDRLLISGLIGCWAFALLSLPESDGVKIMVIIGASFGSAVYCVHQVLQYVKFHAPPISLLGRLVTGRWIIPSYDSALVPILYFSGILALVIYLVQPGMAWPLQVVLPVGLTLYLFLMNLACPDLNKWRLTSQTRLTPWLYAAGKTEFEQL